MSWLEIRIQCPEGEARDILMAEMMTRGAESFAEEGETLIAYCSHAAFREGSFGEWLRETMSRQGFLYTVTDVPEKNWNEVWEREFQPVFIGDQCVIRASFHPVFPGILYQILIDPKMSFGTGHHATTELMITFLLDMDLAGKSVLDMGSGTGVLAILSEMLGASGVLAVDNDAWAFENAKENVQKNNSSRVSVILGDVSNVKQGPFDVILANINRNILVHDLPYYSTLLKDDGQLLMSGFYEVDLPVILEAANKERLKLDQTITKNEWMAVRLTR